VSARAYLTASLATARKVADTQIEPIADAGQALATALAAGHHIWAFGTGHSHMIAEEIFIPRGRPRQRPPRPRTLPHAARGPRQKLRAGTPVRPG